ncbi:MAG TPA: hypothetical protein VMU96_04810 [Casimicrobiaceae bacterium]|nr:hypothetical protein [Casimicrobiaceae bacterium]
MNSVEHASRRSHRLVAAAAAVAIAFAGAHAWAKEEAPKSEHPRKSEVAKRDRHLAGQANKDYGDLSGHYNELQKQDAAIRKQANADMKANGGHLTKAQQKQLNGEENALHAEIKADKGAPPKTQFEQNHPRRAEVLHRDNRINGELNADAGKLGGNYGSLKQQQQSIRQQEQMDARANGGYITKSQQQQLNTEETQLNQEIKVDHK